MVAHRCNRRLGVFRQDAADEFTVMGRASRTWLSVGPFSVLLNRTHEGLIVDVWAKGQEDGECLRTISVMNDEAES